MPSDERSWNWIDEISKKYPNQSFFASLIAITYFFYFLYLVIIYRVEQNIDFYTHIAILDAFVLVAYLLIGTKYFTSNMRVIFQKLETYPEDKNLITELLIRLEKQFTKSKAYYLLLFMVFTPYIFIPPPERSDFWYFSDPSIWSALVDIFNWTLTLLTLYLMATILWVIFNISWMLDEMGQQPYKEAIKIDLLSSDKVGGLKPLTNLVLYISIFQFVAMSLAIINFIDPENISYEEIIFFLTLFLVSVYFFFKGGYAINELLENKRAKEINQINKLYHEMNISLLNAISNKDAEDKEGTLNQISKSMELLRMERERMLIASRITFNIKENFIFFASALLPFITAYVLPLFKE